MGATVSTVGEHLPDYIHPDTSHFEEEDAEQVMVVDGSQKLSVELSSQLRKPLDASDVQTLTQAREEIARIRYLLSLTPLPCTSVVQHHLENRTNHEVKYGDSFQVSHKRVEYPCQPVVHDKSSSECLNQLSKALQSLGMSASEFLEEIEKKGERFVDTDFPPSAESLAHDWSALDEAKAEEWRKYTWKRIVDIVQDPSKLSVFETKISPMDITQGQIGDCYFLSSLAVLSEKPGRIRKLFVGNSTQLSSIGCYVVQMCLDGEWKQIIVDDFVPCMDLGMGNWVPAFAQPNQGAELWVLLLEKAWAKWNGSYQSINGGSPGQMLHSLTGAPTNRYETDDPADLWAQLKRAQLEDFVAAGSIYEHPADLQNTIGLIESHSYAILHVEDIGNEKLIKLRNPWGKVEWNGDWSDSSTKWTPELRNRLKSETADDGVFFMSLEDFCRYFDVVHINLVRDTWHYASSKPREFCVQDKSKLPNPGSGLDPKRRAVVLIETPGKAKVTVTIHQADRRNTKLDNPDDMLNEYLPVKHYTVYAPTVNLLETENPSRDHIHKPTFEHIGASTYLAGRDVKCLNLNLKKGNHLVFVSTSGAQSSGTRHRFVASAYGQVQCKVRTVYSNQDELATWDMLSKHIVEAYKIWTRTQGQEYKYSEHGHAHLSLHSWSNQIEGVACLLFENHKTRFSANVVLHETVTLELVNMRLAWVTEDTISIQDEATSFVVDLKPGLRAFAVMEQIDLDQGYSFAYRRQFSFAPT